MRLLLVDSAALVFRGHYAFISRPLTRKDGQQTSGLHGFCNTLLTTVERVRPTHMAVAMDMGKPTFRHELYEKYKANRPPCPPELVWQLQQLQGLAEALGGHPLGIVGYEADDIIGSLATKAEREEMEVIILSGDKDFMQLLSDKVSMLKPMKGEGYESVNGAQVFDQIGVRADQVVDYLSLIGDTSDNVPGASGIGKVTAAKLLQEYGTLQAMLDYPDRLERKRFGQVMKDSRDQLLLSQKLVTIDKTMSGLPELDELRFKGFDLAQCEEKLNEMELNRVLNRLRQFQKKSEVPVDAPAKEVVAEQIGMFTLASPLDEFDAPEVSIIEDPAQLLSLTDTNFWVHMEAGQQNTFLLISSGDKVVGVQINNDMAEDMRQALSQTLLRGVLGWNLKPLMLELVRYRIRFRLVDDVYLMMSLVDQGQVPQDISSLNADQWGIRLPKAKELTQILGRGMKWEDLPLDRRLGYRAVELLSLPELYKKLVPVLAESTLKKVYDEIELPLLPTLTEMERIGIRVDPDVLAGQNRLISAELDRLTTMIYQLAGEEFNINSTQQLGIILFEKLRLQDQCSLKTVKKTKTGYATDSVVLQAISSHPMGKSLLKYRQLSKLKSTYLDSLPNELSRITGRIHTTYHQNSTATGRLASLQPNLQNIPMRSPEGAAIREAFKPAEGGLLISADYSQIELRVMAHLSQEAALIRAFAEGVDIHQATAASVFSISLDQVDKYQRAQAKTVNFGLMYGMGARHLAEETGLSHSEAKEFIEKYFQSFPGLKEFFSRLVHEARETGAARTLAGRVRLLPDMNHANGRVRNMAENMAVNTPIQGSAADIIKLAMIRLQRTILKNKAPLKLLLQVHDELVLECPASEVVSCINMVKAVMEDRSELPFEFSVPLEVQVSSGDNWLQAH